MPNKVALQKRGPLFTFWPVARQKRSMASAHAGWHMLALQRAAATSVATLAITSNTLNEDEEDEDDNAEEEEDDALSAHSSLVGDLDALVDEVEAEDLLEREPKRQKSFVHSSLPSIAGNCEVASSSVGPAHRVQDQDEISEIGVAIAPRVLPKAARAAPVAVEPRQHGIGVWLACGKITYYPHRQIFEAVCVHPDHNADGATCKMSRTSKGKQTKAGMQGGRPCGFLLAWLKWGSELHFKQQHWDKLAWE
eukprot:4088861-Amphidinium_carterae.3